MSNQYVIKPQTDPETIEKRRRRIMELRRDGVLWDEVVKIISTEFGKISLVMCTQDFRIFMKERVAQLHEPTDAVRQAMVDRLDMAIAGIVERVKAGSLDHIEVLIKLESRRARLLGLDAPSERVIDDKRDRPKLSIQETLDRLKMIQDRVRAHLPDTAPGVIEATVLPDPVSSEET